MLSRTARSTIHRVSRLRYFSAQSAPATSLNKSPTPIPAPSSTTSPGSSTRVDAIVESISRLTLLETSHLIKRLKIELKIEDSMMMAAPSASTGSSSAAASNVEAPVAEAPKIEKTEFSIKLEKFDASTKAKVIREMKAIMPGSSLIEAKKFVEAAPKVIKENASKEEVEKIKKALEAVGATVSVA